MDAKHSFLVSPLINSFSLIPCPGRTLVIAGMWHQGACLSWCGWPLMGDYTPNTSVIRAADLITHRHMIICFPCASVGAAPAHVCISARTDVVARGASGASFSRLLVCSLSFFVYAACFARAYISLTKCLYVWGWKSRQNKLNERGRDRYREKKKNKKKNMNLLMSACLLAFVCLFAVCM